MTTSPVAEFDPTAVPPFPVVTMALGADGTVTVNGRPITVADDNDPSDVGVEEVARYAAQAGLEAVRVRATSPEGDHQMVVTAAGATYEVTDPEAESAPRTRPKALVALLIAGSLFVGCGATAGVWTLTRDEPAPVATAPALPPGYLANLPVVAPPGYAQQAAWSLPVLAGTTPLLLGDGRVAYVTENEALVIVDGSTGATLWRGAGDAPRSVLHAAQLDGRPVIVAEASGVLNAWPIDTGNERRTPPLTLELPSDAEATFLGSAPLLTLPDQTVAFLDGTSMKRLDVPVTAAPILATDDHVIAVGGQSWWTLRPNERPQAHTLPVPAGTTGEPLMISAADDTHLIVVWEGSTRSTVVVTLVDLESNTIAAHGRLSSGSLPRDPEPIRASTGSTLTFGAAFIDYGDSPRVVNLGDVDPEAVDGNTVYALQDRAAIATGVTGDTPELLPFPTSTVTRPVLPFAATPDHAYVVASKVDETLLYALPRQKEEPQ